jgi:LacI family transcriptional regulator
MVILQKDIAEKLNLSITTVSRSLRQDPRIPQETRAKVMSLAARTGYRPKGRNEDYVMNPVGSRNLPSKTVQEPLMLAAFVQADDITACENAFREIAGMGKAAHDHQVSLILHSVPFGKKADIHLPENQPEAMRAGKVKGVVLLNLFEPESVARLVSQTACVSVDILYPHLHMDCVGEENVESMHNLVEHLCALGHRRVGFVDELLEFSATTARVAGFVSGILRAGLPLDPRHILHARERKNAPDGEGLEVLHQWIREGITAIVCVGNTSAIEVYRWLNAHHYQCPEQVSITGFGAMPALTEIPPLTTMRVHHQDIGRLAVERLILRLKEPTLPSVHVTVECELEVGKTTGPAPAGG